SPACNEYKKTSVGDMDPTWRSSTSGPASEQAQEEELFALLANGKTPKNNDFVRETGPFRSQGPRQMQVENDPQRYRGQRARLVAGSIRTGKIFRQGGDYESVRPRLSDRRPFGNAE